MTAPLHPRRSRGASDDLITRLEHAEVIRVVAAERDAARAEAERLRDLLGRIYPSLARDDLAREVEELVPGV